MKTMSLRIKKQFSEKRPNREYHHGDRIKKFKVFSGNRTHATIFVVIEFAVSLCLFFSHVFYCTYTYRVLGGRHNQLDHSCLR